MKKALIGLAPALVIAAMSAPALGTDMVNMTLVALNGQGISYDYDDGSDAFSGNTTAGLFQWVVNSSTSDDISAGQALNSFCVELLQNVHVGNSYDYEVVDPTEVPAPNGFLDPGMSTEQASMISSLFDQHWDDANDGSSLSAAAFQIAVWEIVYEGGQVDFGDGSSAATGFNTQDGWFTASNNNGATDLADQWLASLFNNGVAAALIGFFSPGAQDQITIVPLPAPVALAGLGLLGVGLGRRRIAQLVS